MNAIEPLEKVESVADPTLLPLMKAFKELPAASISTVYQVVVL